MRGQVKAQIRGRAGACPRRLFSFPFRECGEDFAAPAASDFLSDEKVTKESPGDGSGWALMRPYSPFPRSPVTEDALLRDCASFPARKNGVAFRDTSRATWPWVCKNCRWCGFTTAPGFAEPTLPVPNLGGRPKGLPYPNHEGCLGTCRGGACPSRPEAFL